MTLALTPEAVEAIHSIVADHEPGAGLRISAQSSDSERVQLGLAVAPGPEPSDEVVEDQGSKVFVAEDVAPLLDGRTLDVRSSGEGRSFQLLP